MPKLIDLTGQRFGRWVVLKKAPPRPSGNAYWVCKCDCGTVKEVSGQSLRNRDSTSCGCYQKERFSEMWRRHGKSKTRLYNVWSSMRERCYCPSCDAYQYYGADGITVCDEWQDYSAFERWALSHGYDPTAKSHQCTIDRIDNTKGYSPDNCRWVDSITQSNNQRKNIILVFNGESKSVAEWSRQLGWNYGVIYNRIVRYGWDVKRTLTEPPRDWSPIKCKKSV